MRHGAPRDWYPKTVGSLCDRLGNARFFGRIAADSIAAQVGAREMMEAEVEAFAAALKKASRAADNTVTNYRRDLLAFRSFLIERAAILGKRVDEIDVASITADHIRSYLAELMKTAKRATVQRRLSAIKAFFRYRETTIGAAESRRDRFARRRTSGACRRYCRRTKFAGCSKSSPDDSTPAAMRDRAIFETLYSSGLRVGELVGLDWRDIDEELGMVMVRAGKGNKDRLVPLGEPALDALKAWRRAMPVAWEPDGPVITNLRGGRLTTRSVETILQRRLEAAGVSAGVNAARAASLFRNAYAWQWGRPAVDTGDARPCEPGDHAALYSCQRESFERGLSTCLPTSLTGVSSRAPKFATRRF